MFCMSIIFLPPTVTMHTSIYEGKVLVLLHITAYEFFASLSAHFILEYVYVNTYATKT